MTGLTTPIDTYPFAPTPYTGTEAAIGTGADGVTTQQLQVSAIAALGANGQSVATIAALRALTSLGGGPGAIVVRSYVSPGDGGGGLFVYDANDTTTADNGGTIIAPTGTLTGRWYRLFSGALDIRWFGGVAGGPTASGGFDNAAALTAAVACVSVGSNPHVAGPRIYFPGSAQSYGFAAKQFFKKTVILEGDSLGMPNGNGYPSILEWPANVGGLKFEYFNTFNNAIVTPTSGSDGSIIQNLCLKGAGSADDISHGIDTRVRIKIKDCVIETFAGNGANIVASSTDVTGATTGNANEWVIDTITLVGNQGHAVFIDGPDSNAGCSTAIGVTSSGLAGILDSSFLGNTHVAAHIDGCGSRGLGQVTLGGNIYSLINNTTGIGGTTTPGTNNAIWYLVSAGSGPPAWASGGTYRVSSPVFNDDVNSRGTWINPYIESGLPISHLVPPAMALGVNIQNFFTTFSPAQFSASGQGGFFSSNTGFGGFKALPSGDLRGSFQYCFAGPDGLHIATQAGLSLAVDVSSGDVEFRFASFQNAAFMTSNLTTQTFGRSAIVPYATNIQLLALGPGAAARVMTNGTAAPTTGPHAQGEIVWNSACTAAGQPSYWQCTAAGTPGTWVAHNL